MNRDDIINEIIQVEVVYIDFVFNFANWSTVSTSSTDIL